MILEDYIPYELALVMRDDFGLRGSPIYRYNPKQTSFFTSPRKWFKESGEPYVYGVLYQEVFRYFREDFGWSIKINQVLKDEWIFTVENFNLDKTKFGGRFKNYEEAEIACLVKLIEIVKEK